MKVACMCVGWSTVMHPTPCAVPKAADSRGAVLSVSVRRIRFVALFTHTASGGESSRVSLRCRQAAPVLTCWLGAQDSAGPSRAALRRSAISFCSSVCVLPLYPRHG